MMSVEVAIATLRSGGDEEQCSNILLQIVPNDVAHCIFASSGAIWRLLYRLVYSLFGALQGDFQEIFLTLVCLHKQPPVDGDAHR